MQEKKILIVEDSQQTYKQLSTACYEALADHYDVKIVIIDNGRQAIEAIEKNSDYGICVCDFILPGANGLEVAAALYKANPSCPIVMVTSELQVEEETKKIKSIRCWMLKPVSPLRFKDVLLRIILPATG